MPSVLRAACVAFHLVSLIFLASPFSVTPALAKPLPLILPSISSRSSDLVSRGRHLTAGPQTENDYTVYDRNPSNHSESRRALDSILNNIDLMNTYGGKLSSSATTFRAIISFLSFRGSYISLSETLASQSSGQGNSAAYNQKVASGLTEVYTNFQQFSTAYGGLDKGIANYDKYDELETILKNTVNCMKSTMSTTYNLVVAIPAIGSMLGPGDYLKFLAALTPC